MNKKSRHPTNHRCQSIVVSCMDFRFRNHFREWTVKNALEGGFDRIAIAGGVKNLPFVLEQIELSVKLHGISQVYLINHEDCGAYGKKGTFKIHKEDLLFAKEILRKKFPLLKIALLFQKLNGEFIPV